MLKFIGDTLCSFDAEWVPNIDAGRRRYRMPADADAEAVLEAMYVGCLDYDAEKNPRPYLPTPLCRVECVAAAWWTPGKEAAVHSWSEDDEARTVLPFLALVGQYRPQLWSFNGMDADIPILLQRALVHHLTVPAFAQRPAKPWEGVDYFDRYSGWHVDLRDTPLMGRRGSLADLCACLDLPGKGAIDGGDVAGLVAAGDRATVRRYCEADAMRVMGVAAKVLGIMGRWAPLTWRADALERHPEWAGVSA